ncbi:hypothetical protein TCAL_15625 [Tigriopus californicus]|uniref:Reverse transcriptase domain-containing protein n=1 Tax=Tigriopus californicus TaxID=6832 RepID=A0A553PCJ0_TIGCA|nr:hypothetical protein TCAL_15625 [Tigriopus californicus]
MLPKPDVGAGEQSVDVDVHDAPREVPEWLDPLLSHMQKESEERLMRFMSSLGGEQSPRAPNLRKVELSRPEKLDKSIQIKALWGLMTTEMLGHVKHTMNVPMTTTRSVKTVLDVIQTFLRSKRNLAVDHLTLEKCHQEAGQPFDDFLVKIRKIAEDAQLCSTCLDTRLVARIIAGVNDSTVWSKLLSLNTLPSLKDTVDLCRAEETAHIDVDKMELAETARDHVSHVVQILERCRSSRITLNPEKCKIGNTEVAFAGFFNTVERWNHCQIHLSSLPRDFQTVPPKVERPFEMASCDLFSYAGHTYLVYPHRPIQWLARRESLEFGPLHRLWNSRVFAKRRRAPIQIGEIQSLCPGVEGWP